MNFIRMPVSDGKVAAGAERLPVPHGSGPEIILGLRGEAVALASLPEGLEMRVRVAEPMGSHLLLTGMIENQPVRVILPAGEKVASGDVIGLKLDPARVSWLSPDDGKAYLADAA